jgi:hypothetical protein
MLWKTEKEGMENRARELEKEHKRRLEQLQTEAAFRVCIELVSFFKDLCTLIMGNFVVLY